MLRNILLYSTLSLMTFGPAFAAAPSPAGGGAVFGSKSQIKVVNGGPLKEGTSFAIGSFRVTFITSDKVVSVAKGGWATASASAQMNGTLIGLAHPTMQKLADQVYADFLQQATAKGLTLVDSVKFAAASPSYKAMATTPNYEEGRLGTVVIPTGQQSVPLSEDHSENANKGSKGIFAQIKQQQTALYASSDANKIFPIAAKEVGMPVIGVTIIVNFGDFQGATHNWGGSHVKVLPGATVDGGNKMELLRATSMLAWGPKTCPACMAQVLLEGTIHSDESIGDTEASKSRRSISTTLGGDIMGSSASKDMTIVVDLPAYEKNVLIVTSQTSGLMLAELGTK